MDKIFTVFKRELLVYFATPIAYVFMIIFLLLSGISTFYIGNFLGRGQADLVTFFNFHPWLYLLLIPALSMRLWSEERKTGTIELLLTLPITMPQAVIGKFLAAWVFAGLSLMLTLPIWITVNYLGDPDNGAIVAGYFGSFLLAGSFIAIGSCMSTLNKNQVVAFVLTLIVCLMYVVSGFSIVLDVFKGWAPQLLLDTISSFSFLTHFNAISKGVIDLRDLIYFTSLIVFWLFATATLIELKKAD
jgi:ABC-2 type transport system permease protein